MFINKQWTLQPFEICVYAEQTWIMNGLRLSDMWTEITSVRHFYGNKIFVPEISVKVCSFCSRPDQKPTEHICVNESVNVTVIEITECFTFQAKIG